jgi:hypothetical protein
MGENTAIALRNMPSVGDDASVLGKCDFGFLPTLIHSHPNSFLAETVSHPIVEYICYGEADVFVLYFVCFLLEIANLQSYHARYQ